MRIIPRNTRVAIEFFKGISLADVLVGLVGVAVVVFLFMSNLAVKYWLMLGVAVFFAMLLVQVDSDKTYQLAFSLLRHLAYRRRFRKLEPPAPEGEPVVLFPKGGSRGKSKSGSKRRRIASTRVVYEEEPPPVPKKGKKQSAPRAKRGKKEYDLTAIAPFTGVADGFIEYGGDYYAAVLEIPPLDFLFFSEHRQNTLIDRAFGAVLRTVTGDMAASLVKIDRPLNLDKYIAAEQQKAAEIKEAFCNGLLTEQELTTRIGILYGRIEDLIAANTGDQTIKSFHYLVLYDPSRSLLQQAVLAAHETLAAGEIASYVLDDEELAVFLKYNYTLDFDEREVYSLDPADYLDWILPESIRFHARTVEIDDVVTYNLRVFDYPTTVGNAWGAQMFDIPGTKVTMMLTPVEKSKAVQRIDRAIDELRGQSESTGKTSRLIDIENHLQTLAEVLAYLQNDNETLFEVNLYITIYDWQEEGAALKKRIRRQLQEESFKTEDLFLQQFEAYVGGMICKRDPLLRKSRGIHSTSVAAVFPFVHCALEDDGGINLGYSSGLPVFVNFFERNDKRVNSNMVIIGKSGSGKSYATKMMLSNLSAEDSKVFILDPENEYGGIARRMHGKIIDVGSAKQGRLNPFHIVASVDEEDPEEGGAAGSFVAHLQFLEEFFRQILPGVDTDAMEQLNNLIVRMYEQRDIDETTNIAALRPEDFPTFDDLYDKILGDYQSSSGDFTKNNLRILLTHISKFATGGRNAALWNGQASISTNENFVCFNFQSLLANKNNTIANAQMLLVLKWLDNEIIKNRDYNLKFGQNRKIIIVVDEAHVFIDPKHPVALDFMFQLAKRIRKYNGMQVIITQNIKDFLGSEEIARKSSAIINACQYSFIFSLAPNDMHDLCKLYEKAGEINETEQEQIISNPRGHAFVVTSPTSRTSIQIVASPEVSSLF